MKQTLSIAKDLSLPASAVTQTFGILAVRGAGKSNTAAVMAEEMFAAGLPFVVIDPVGAWYGLRSSADGKTAGLAVPIFGGAHGDLPLERGAGELLADLVTAKRLSCVIDLSRVESEGDKKTFLLAFARRLYLKNADPLHLFLEEADDYIPQKPMRDEAQLLRAWENIVRRGRTRGLGMTLITQRSAAINKMVLTQVETLIAMRTTSPQDRAAVEAWVKYHQTGDDVIASLSSLRDGEAWVWSPHFLGGMWRVQIRRRRTFDSGATPKNLRGTQAKRAATLADVDLEAVQAEMAATIDRARAEDPRELRREIARLKADLAQTPRTAPRVVERFVLNDRQLARVAQILDRMDTLADRFRRLEEPLRVTATAIRDAIARTRAPHPAAPTPTVEDVPRPRAQPRRPAPAATARLPRPVAAAGSSNGDERGLTPAQQRILDALAFVRGIGVDPVDKTQLALMAQVPPTSGGYKNNLGSLRSAGYLAYPTPGTVTLTSQGAAVADAATAPQTTEELHRAIRAKLPPAKWRIVDALITRYPQAIEKGELARLCGVPDTSGGYKNNLGSLRSLGLVDYPQPGLVAAQPVLFLEDR